VGERFRLHGWAATRWWWWAGLIMCAAILSTRVPEWSIPVTAAAAGLFAKWKTPLPWGWVVSAPLTFLLLWVGWDVAAEVVVAAAFLLALFQTFEWSAYSIEVRGKSLVIHYSFWWPRTANISQRQIASAEVDRGPFNLYTLLGYARVTWDTSGQVEYVNRIPYATPQLVAALEVG